MDEIDPSSFLSILSSSDNNDIKTGLVMLLQFFDDEEYSFLNKLPYTQIYQILLTLLCNQQDEEILNNATHSIVRLEKYVPLNQKSAFNIQNPSKLLQSIFNLFNNSNFSNKTKSHILCSLFQIVFTNTNKNSIFDFSGYQLFELIQQYSSSFIRNDYFLCFRMLNHLWTIYSENDNLHSLRDSLFGNQKCLQFFLAYKKRDSDIKYVHELIKKIIFTYKIYDNSEECFNSLIEIFKEAKKSQTNEYIHLLNSYLSTYSSIKSSILNQSNKFNFSYLINSKRSDEFIEIMLTLSLSLIPKPAMNSIDKLFEPKLFQWNLESTNFEQVKSHSDKMVQLITNFYLNQARCKLILLKSLSAFSFIYQKKLDLSDALLYNLVFDAEEQQYAFYIAIIVSNLSQEKKKLIFRTDIFNTLQLHQYEPPLNDDYFDFLNSNLDYEETVLPDEVLSPNTLSDITTAIQNNELFLFDFLNDSNDLFNVCWDLLSSSNSEELSALRDFLFSQGLFVLPLPPSPPDPHPVSEYSELENYVFQISHEKIGDKEIDAERPTFSLDTVFNNDYFVEIIETEARSSDDIKKIFHDFDQIFKQNYSLSVLATDMKIEGFEHFAYVFDGCPVNPNKPLLNSLLEVLDDCQDMNKRMDLQIYHLLDSNHRYLTSYLTKTKERMNENNPIPHMNQFVQNVFELLNEINLQDPSLKMVEGKFLDRIIGQLRSPFLTVGVFTPCTKLMIKYPFLFPFEDRLFFFKVLISDLPIIIKNYSLRYERKHLDLKPVYSWHMQVSRSNIFEEGNRILNRFGKYRIFLEFSFVNEIGTGLGPTHEFFCLMSHEFCKKERGMWRNDDSEGMFPILTAKDELFYQLGLFVAKAIQMNIFIDIPFNPSFFDLLLGRPVELEKVDPYYSKALSNKSSLFGLTFVYPISDQKDIEMIPNGENIEVDEKNVDQYIKLIKEYTIGNKIQSKIDSFKNGFGQIFDLDYFKIFGGKEIKRIVCGDDFHLSLDILKKHIKIGSGFSPQSEQIRFLFEIILEMEYDKQLLFFQFITGNSRLPVGGLAAIYPPLTVARRVADDQYINEDEPLPTVLTCTHYFKLPAYSTKEIMRNKLMIAIADGATNFSLS